MEDHEINTAIRGEFQQVRIRDVLKEQMIGHESRRKEAKQKKLAESRANKIPDLSKQALNPKAEGNLKSITTAGMQTQSTNEENHLR